MENGATLQCVPNECIRYIVFDVIDARTAIHVIRLVGGLFRGFVPSPKAMVGHHPPRTWGQDVSNKRRKIAIPNGIHRLCSTQTLNLRLLIKFMPMWAELCQHPCGRFRYTNVDVTDRLSFCPMWWKYVYMNVADKCAVRVAMMDTPRSEEDNRKLVGGIVVDILSAECMILEFNKGYMSAVMGVLCEDEVELASGICKIGTGSGGIACTLAGTMNLTLLSPGFLLRVCKHLDLDDFTMLLHLKRVELRREMALWEFFSASRTGTDVACSLIRHHKGDCRRYLGCIYNSFCQLGPLGSQWGLIKNIECASVDCLLLMAHTLRVDDCIIPRFCSHTVSPTTGMFCPVNGVTWNDPGTHRELVYSPLVYWAHRVGLVDLCRGVRRGEPYPINGGFPCECTWKIETLAGL